MATAKPLQSYKDLIIHAFRYGGLETRCKSTVGLTQQFVLIGRIEPDVDWLGDPEPSPWNYKLVRLEISTPPDNKWLGDVARSLRVQKPIGVLSVNAGVEPEHFEIDGEVHETEPIRARVMLSQESFGAVLEQAQKAYAQYRILSVMLQLAGQEIPEDNLPKTSSGEPIGFEPFGASLKDFNTSEDQSYAIESIKITDTRFVDEMQGRVSEVAAELGGDHGVFLSVLLVDAQYTAYIRSGQVRPVSCSGVVVFDDVLERLNKRYPQVEVSVHFEEHETNRFDELPERAPFGEFYCRPGGGSASLDLTLKYLVRDARDLFFPILSQIPVARTVLFVNLITDKNKQELLTGSNDVKGQVRSYRFEVKGRAVEDDQ